MFQQYRYRSTFLLRRTYITRKPLKRYVWVQPTYRRVAVDPLQHVQTRETLERVEHIKNDLRRAARQNKSPVRFGTTFSHQSEDNVQSAEDPALSHLTSSGAAHMINVGHKKETHRSATATAHLLFSSVVAYRALVNATVEKGDALAVARIAGIQAAKKTSDLIPLAHPGLGITAVTIDLKPFPGIAKWSRVKPDVKRIQNLPSTLVSDSAPDSGSANHLNEEPIIESDHGGVHVSATVECYGKTGVEMEALTAANVAMLTMYDMLKGVDKAMLISGCRVTEKRGGKSGSWRWNNDKRRIEKFNDNAGNASKTTMSTMTKSSDETSHKETLRSGEDALSKTHHSNSVEHSTNSNDSVSLPWTKPKAESYSPSTTLPVTDSSDDAVASVDETHPQAIFESEWEALSKSFDQANTHPSTSNTGTNTNTNATDPDSPDPTQADNTQTRLRDQLSGAAHAKPDAASFRRARIERYEEWKKSH